LNPSAETALEVRVHGDRSKPCLIYLPGVHGDWTLFTSFRELAKEDFFVVEISYPRTLKWSMEDYGRAVAAAVEQLGISRAWVLAESYSSQVAWAWLKLAQSGATPFRFEGLILAGGFVRYPFPWLVRAAGKFFDVAPWRLWKILFCFYIWYSSFRHRNAPESASSAHEFVARRTKLDIAAMRHRLRLIYEYDPREIAAAATCPIYLLAGMIDPVVATWPVLRWLRKHCPAVRAHRIIWPADHNVLGTEPGKSLAQIAAWVQSSHQRSV
jgi:pimeloyl-ACP methyl ester carboxylesterase